MSQALSSLLAPQIVTELISLLAPGRGSIGSWLGFHPTRYDANTVSVAGPNTLTTGTTVRTLTYRIFNNTRVPMKFRSPNTGPSTRAANPMAQNTVTIARAHEKITLQGEFLGNLSSMIGPNSQIDTMGQAYIAQQTAYLSEIGNRTVEFMAVGMMRDSLYLVNTGNTDDWLPSFTAPSNPTSFGVQISFQIPAGNKSQLNMLGAGDIIGTTWANVAAPIIGDINQVIAAFAQLTARRLTDIFINSTMWINIISNTEVRNTAGSANTPFAELRYDTTERTNNGPPMRKAVIRGAPDVRFNMVDDSFALGNDTDPINTSAGGNVGTLNKYVPDTMAIFTTEADGTWAKLYYGGEPVAEYPGGPMMPRMGWYMWNMTTVEPTALNLYSMLNAVPALLNPAVVAPGTTIF